MGFLPKKWLFSLWGVRDEPMTFAAPIDCDDCRRVRAAGGDACEFHGAKHPGPHTYRFGHMVSWGSPLSQQDAMPTRESVSIH